MGATFRKNAALFLPVIVIGIMLGYTWTTIISQQIIINWRHITATALFAVLVLLFFKKKQYALPATGIFLLLGLFNLLTLTPAVSLLWIYIGRLAIPMGNMMCLLLFLVYFFLNLDPLLDMQIAYSEAKRQRKAKTD